MMMIILVFFTSCLTIVQLSQDNREVLIDKSDIESMGVNDKARPPAAVAGIELCVINHLSCILSVLFGQYIGFVPLL